MGTDERMRKIVMVIALISAPAYAQAPTQTQPEITLKVTPADITLLGEGLGMLPYAKVAPLMQKLQIQINQQQQPTPVPPSPDAKKDEPKKD